MSNKQTIEEVIRRAIELRDKVKKNEDYAKNLDELKKIAEKYKDNAYIQRLYASALVCAMAHEGLRNNKKGAKKYFTKLKEVYEKHKGWVGVEMEFQNALVNAIAFFGEEDPMEIERYLAILRESYKRDRNHFNNAMSYGEGLANAILKYGEKKKIENALKLFEELSELYLEWIGTRITDCYVAGIFNLVTVTNPMGLLDISEKLLELMKELAYKYKVRDLHLKYCTLLADSIYNFCKRGKGDIDRFLSEIYHFVELWNSQEFFRILGRALYYAIYIAKEHDITKAREYYRKLEGLSRKTNDNKISEYLMEAKRNLF